MGSVHGRLDTTARGAVWRVHPFSYLSWGLRLSDGERNDGIVAQQEKKANGARRRSARTEHDNRKVLAAF